MPECVGKMMQPIAPFLNGASTVVAASPLLVAAPLMGLAGGKALAVDAGVAIADLGSRARAIHSAVGARTQNATTIAAGMAQDATGTNVTLIASSEGRLRPAQRAALQAGEVAVAGRAGVHAEQNLMNAAENMGLSVRSIGASRPICPACANLLRNAGVAIMTALK